MSDQSFLAVFSRFFVREQIPCRQRCDNIFRTGLLIDDANGNISVRHLIGYVRLAKYVTSV